MVIASLVAMNACTFSDEVELFNNTGTGLVVRACDRAERVGDGLVVKLVPWCEGPVEVQFTTTRWTYRRITDRYTIQKAGVRTSRGNYVLKLQLQSDGSIGVLSPKDTYPVATFVSQPEGFPIHPMSELTARPGGRER